MADWNPIEVPDNVALTEYLSYVPRILDSINNKEKIFICLTQILWETLQYEYDPSNESISYELTEVVNKIYSIGSQTLK